MCHNFYYGAKYHLFFPKIHIVKKLNENLIVLNQSEIKKIVNNDIKCEIGNCCMIKISIWASRNQFWQIIVLPPIVLQSSAVIRYFPPRLYYLPKSWNAVIWHSDNSVMPQVIMVVLLSMYK